MTFLLATALVTVCTAYALAGVAFAAWFVPRRAATSDPGLAGAGLTVRLLITPGIVLLWPVFVRRLLAATAAPTERNAHRQAAREVGPALQGDTP
jgi:hypothetical protein